MYKTANQWPNNIFTARKNMRIKLFLFLGTCFLFITIVYGAYARQAHSLLGVLPISVQAKGELCQKRSALPEDTIPILTFQGMPIPYDSATRTFYLPVSGQAEWDSGTLCLPDDGIWTHLYIVQNTSFQDDKLSMVKSGQAYELFIYNRLYYQTCQLILTTLPVMSIDFLQESSLEDPDNPVGDYDTLTHMTLREPSPDSGFGSLTESDALIRIRGNASSYFPKKSYRMSLVSDGDSREPENLNLLGLRQDDDWILNSLYADRTKIREPLAMEVWDQIDGDTLYHSSLSMKYVEVILNGRYWGLYGLTYPVDAKGLGLEWNGQRHDILYKTTGSNMPSLEEIEEAIALSQDAVSSVEIKYPDLMDRSGLWLPFRNMLAVITGWDGDMYSDNIVNYIDIENTVNYWLFLQFASLTDNCWKNQYFAARNLEGGIYKIYIVPWDFDYSFGISYDEDSPLSHGEVYDKSQLLQFIMGNKTLENNTEGSVDMAVENWDNARAAALTQDYLYSRIDALYEELSASGVYPREYGRWPNDFYMEDGSGINFMKKYIEERIDFMDDYLHHLKI